MNVINPASKNWLMKYLALIEQGKILINQEYIEKNSLPILLREAAFKTGFMFGLPKKTLFYKGETNSWTREEILKIIFFEHLVLIYFKTFKKINNKEVVKSLLGFFININQSKKPNFLSLFFKYKPNEKLEKIINAKVFIPNTYLTKVWKNYIHNSLCFIDVIAYSEYLIKQAGLKKKHESYIEKTLYTLIEASKADGIIGPKEKNLIEFFLASAPLKKDLIKKLENHLISKSTNPKLEYLEKTDNKLFNLYLLDIGAFTIFVDLEIVEHEYSFIKNLKNKLGLSEKELDSSIAMTQAFILEQNNKNDFLKYDKVSQKLFHLFVKRWIKILGRNKDKILLEIQESKDLVYLVKKSFKEELTEKEKEVVKNQFKDIVKSVPTLTLFMLPGGSILLPLILKIIPSLLPSAFRDNEIN